VSGMLSFADDDGAQAGTERSVLSVFARERLGRLLTRRTRVVGQHTATANLKTHGSALSSPALSGPALVSAEDEDVALLLYELLDAHADTAQLVAAHGSDAEWQAHVDYLRALQRAGRGTLARLGAP
jgi:hypothetical protein